MAIRKLMPAVQASLAATMAANINAEIDAVNSVWTDVALPYPTVVNGYRSVLPEPPYVVISWLNTKVQADASSAWQGLAHTFEVAILCQDIEENALDNQVQRYLTAIWEVGVKVPQLDGTLAGLIGLGWDRADKSVIYQHKTSKMLLQSAAWTGTVYLDESS